MVEFGKLLEAEQGAHDAAWAGHCIDYNSLKKTIKRINEEPTLTGSRSSSRLTVYQHNDSLHPTTCRSTRFRYELDNEIERAVLYCLEVQGILASDLDSLSVKREKFVDAAHSMLQFYVRGERLQSALEELQNMHNEYSRVGMKILSIVKFVDLNVTAVRKILKKHDKNSNKKLSHSYLSAYTNESADSHLDQLYNNEGLASLVLTLKRAFAELRQVEAELLGHDDDVEDDKKANYRRSSSLPAVAELAHRTHQSSPSMWSVPDLVAITHEKEPVLSMIRLARDRLKTNSQYVDIIAAQLMFDDDSDENDDKKLRRDEMTDTQKLSSFLNLCSTFLYMTNYYIVAPTCGMYAERLGSTEAFAGYIIGMTPNAALLATVLYGWWSNHSYKSAFVFAASCSVTGNIFYALALHYRSLTFVLIGRFLNGFGSARSINRRFIADTFNKHDRTAASAAFVTAAALGMAAGPALAAMLSHVDYGAEGTMLTLETSPGWVMLLLWSCFLLFFVLFFEEPDRSHIFGNTRVVEPDGKVEGESKYLLESQDRQPTAEGAESEEDEPPIYSNVPVMMTLWLYFMLKLVLETLLSSAPMLTKFFFSWDSSYSGSFLACLGLLMFPANVCVARLSHRYEDRELIYHSMVLIMISLIGIVSYFPGHYSQVQYCLFAICIFIGTNAMEGPNMSLLSKSVPKRWARGILNSGFLATESGTLARSVGDVLISVAASAGVANMLSGLFLRMLALVVASFLLLAKYYDRMIEREDEDDKSMGSLSNSK